MKNKALIHELKKLAAQHGGLLRPEMVVAAARPKTSPLHSQFTWDDSKAAHEYRIWQARQLIRVSVEVLSGTNKDHNVFVSLTTDRQQKHGGYRVVADVLSNEQMRDQMMADAMAELELFREKYRDLQELSAIFDSINKVKKKRKPAA